MLSATRVIIITAIYTNFLSPYNQQISTSIWSALKKSELMLMVSLSLSASSSFSSFFSAFFTLSLSFPSLMPVSPTSPSFHVLVAISFLRCSSSSSFDLQSRSSASRLLFHGSAAGYLPLLPRCPRRAPTNHSINLNDEQFRGPGQALR